MKLFLLICLIYFFCSNVFPFIFSASLAHKFGGETNASSDSPCSANIQPQRCQCGKNFRNLSSTRIIAGKKYDTVVPLGEGLDGKVEHAFSHSLGRCVALKTCAEDPTRLSKCTRELKVLQRMREVAPHIVPLEDFEIKTGLPCTEGAVMSDFIRTILIGTEKRRRRRTVNEAEAAAASTDEQKDANVHTDDDNNTNNPNTMGNNCNQVILVEELGSEEVEQYLRKMNAAGRKGQLSLDQIKTMIRAAMDELHSNGIAHRDMHKDNAMLFPVLPLVNHSKNCGEGEGRQQQQWAQKQQTKGTVKVIDMGWACCFDVQKCGPLVGAALPHCAAAKALNDDEFSLQDVFKELGELSTGLIKDSDQ